MEWTLEEFIEEMRVDAARRVLFVEGDHDLSFWRALVPVSDRLDTVIYKIGSLRRHVEIGGERGRIMAIAQELLAHPFSDRIRFFADADMDRVLGVEVPANVILTDGRDREAYLLCPEGYCALCETGFNKTEAFTRDTEQLVSVLLRPLATLRVLSARNGMDLPFQRTLHPRDNVNGQLRRYLSGRGAAARVDVEKLVRALLQNGGIAVNKMEGVARDLEDEAARLQELQNDQVVHGKDLIAFVAWRLGCTVDVAQACVNLATASIVSAIRTKPLLQSAEAWARQ